MARLGRYFLPDQPLHLIQRGNNRQAIFHIEDDYRRYSAWLKDAATANGLAIHAYVLMTNHVHLLVTPQDASSVPRTMQLLGRRYVRYINSECGRTGTLWEGRYRAAPIDSDIYFFSCCRYIELNPVRAGIVAQPKAYRWSSYHAHAHGANDTLISHHPLFKRLGRTVGEQQTSYRALFRTAPDEEFVTALRKATNGGWALGGERFKREIAAALKRRVVPLPPGPRRKAPQDKGQMILL